MPDGMSESMVFLPPITKVCPALWPPWKRATACTWSVSRSTILPLPSSPHCNPITTRFLPIARHPQQSKAGHHADQSAPAKLFGLGLRQFRHQALRGARVQERQNAFQHQVQRKGASQIPRQLTPSDVHGVGPPLALRLGLFEIFEVRAVRSDDEHIALGTDGF